MATDQTYEQALEEIRRKMSTRKGRKHEAQEIILYGVAIAVGYWHERHSLHAEVLESDEDQREFGALIKEQADRVAHLFGREDAWVS